MTAYGESAIPLPLALIVLAAAVVLFVSRPAWATLSQERATRVLEQSGYKDPRFGGYTYFGCGRDVYAIEFNAVSPGGSRGDGYVCCGWFKGCTVRWSD